jgi:phage I-like protein
VKSPLNRKLVIGATGLVLFAGAGGAVAATQLSSNSGGQAYLDDVANHLNVSPSALSAAMKAATVDRIDAAVAAGRLTQAQADALKQHVQQGGTGVSFFGHRFEHNGFGTHGAAAQYLGLTPATLRSELESGKSLAQIASTTPGKTVAGLQAAILAAATTRVEKALSSGLITSQQEQQRLAGLSGMIDSMLQRTGANGWHGSMRFGMRGH